MICLTDQSDYSICQFMVTVFTCTVEQTETQFGPILDEFCLFEGTQDRFKNIPLNEYLTDSILMLRSQMQTFLCIVLTETKTMSPI